MLLVLYLLLVYFCEKGAGFLESHELRISPPIVERGGDVTLTCSYSLTGEVPLYSVKWYRGRHELYRYSPTESPKTKIFPFAGINVDLTRSNETQVVLTRVNFGLSGNFSCEVTADAPSFSTSHASAILNVVSLPKGLPSVLLDKESYAPGDVLRANCTAPPSRPVANLTLFLNDQRITPGLLRTQQTHDGLNSSDLSIAILLLPSHFEAGIPVLTCEATVDDLYKEAVSSIIKTKHYDPRIERVTSEAVLLRSIPISVVAIYILRLMIDFIYKT